MNSSTEPNVYRAPAPVKTPPPAARVAQGSSTRSFPSAGSGTRSVPSAGSSTRSFPSSEGSTRSFPTAGSSTRSVLDSNPQEFSGGSSTRQGFLPDASQGGFSDPNQGFADGSNYFEPNAGNNFDPNFGANTAPEGCDTCGNSLVDGACSNCGPAAGFTDGPVIQDFGTFGSVSAARQYLYVEALVWTRADGDISNSNFGSLNDFDFTGGIRATYGVRNDSTFGSEFSFFALPNVEQEISSSDSGGRLSTFTVPSSINGTAPPAFFNATNQTQTKESDLYSFEYNKVNWGWDLIKTFSGLRFVRFDDSYNVTSTGTSVVGVDPFGAPITGTSNGDSTLDASNTLLGAQLGGELFYDIGYRWSASAFGKWGLFANFSDFDTNFNNDGASFSDESDNFTISTVAELGLTAHYQIRTNLRFRTGYNLMFIGNVATTADNITPPGTAGALFVAPSTSDSDDVLFHGFNFGLEFYR